MDVKFTIGEFAKLNGLQKQTLIFYDNIGLFKPEIVDKKNGYRYYTSSQLEVLDSILTLRELDISLKEIKNFLENRDNIKTLKLLREQKKKLYEQEKKIKRTIKRLENKIKTLEDLNIIEKKEIFEFMNAEYLIVEKVEEPYELLQTDIAFKKLFKNLTEKKHSYTYDIGVIIPKKNLEDKKYVNATLVFVPLYKKMRGKNIIEKEAGIYAVSYHKGKYEDIGRTYETLLSVIKKQGYIMIGDAYEYCILDSLTSATSKDYITKIEIPVKLKED